jgi:hypothetical protein
MLVTPIVRAIGGAILLRVQMHETLYVLLQEGRIQTRNGDAVAVTQLEHCVAVHVGSDRRRQLLHVMNVGEVIELNCVVLWIEVVDRLRALGLGETRKCRCWHRQWRRRDCCGQTLVGRK